MRKRKIATVVYIALLRKLGKDLPTLPTPPVNKSSVGFTRDYIDEVTNLMLSFMFVKRLADLIMEILTSRPELYEAYKDVIIRLASIVDSAKNIHEKLRGI
jgi:hypothetical protein